ncbi:MAG TPA: hypothetical protein VG603_05795, partial [Chitinophagales bacterium]|nr:hypothetical protein [Chitinophagales bacterium]
AHGLRLAAVLERGAPYDIAIVKNPALLNDKNSVATVASGSLRRKAQWLARYPKHTVTPIRGNVQTRLRKFEESEVINAIIFARAGLERLNLLTENAVELPWMLPAPAQGIIGIACRESDDAVKNVLHEINHKKTFKEGAVERAFLQTLMGGCSVPVSAHARIDSSELLFEGAMHSFDGTRQFNIRQVINAAEWETAGQMCAENLLLQLGAKELMEEIRNKKWDDESALN